MTHHYAKLNANFVTISLFWHIGAALSHVSMIWRYYIFIAGGTTLKYRIEFRIFKSEMSIANSTADQRSITENVNFVSIF